MQVGLNLLGGSSLLPYTNKTRDILVAAFRKSVNNDGRVWLLMVQVSLLYVCHIYTCNNTPHSHIYTAQENLDIPHLDNPIHQVVPGAVEHF